MLLDANGMAAAQETRYDVCIIGAGAAGITIALKLGRRGRRVALCEGGGLEFSEESQDSYVGAVIGDRYFDLDIARLRYFGGSTNHWDGWCRSFEDVDFDRGYLSDAFNWPIERKDIEPHLKEACEIVEVESDFSDTLLSEEHGIKRIDFKFSPHVRFAEKFRDELQKSETIDVYLNANLTDMFPRDRRVVGVEFENFNSNKIKIEADTYVLAMGGIENSRQMLWQHTRHGDSLFSSKLPVGRYWMEHPHYHLGEALVDNSVSFGRYYSLTGAAQRNLGIMNCGFRVREQGRTKTKMLLKDLMCVAPSIGKRFFDLADKDLVCGVDFRAAWEQAPHADNRVALSPSETDRFGVPLTRLHWKKRELDKKTIELSVEKFNTWLIDGDFGRVKLDKWFHAGEKYYDFSFGPGGYHHMGGTRMSHSDMYGVVDRNCRVHGTENLYVAGSSVFTTGGHNNPTLAIVQLALRLGEHLSA